MEILYNVGKKAVAIAGALVVAELVCIGGNALIQDAGAITEKVKGVVAKPSTPEPTVTAKLFGRKVK